MRSRTIKGGTVEALFGSPSADCGPGWIDEPSARAPFVRGSETSREASRQIEGVRAGQEERVFNYILSRGAYGATDEEISRDCGLAGSSARPRRIRLADGGIVVASPFKRKTSSGRDAVVYWIAPAHRPDAQLEMDL